MRDAAGSLGPVRAYWERMAKRRGKDLACRVELVRADEGAIRGYLSALAETLDVANAISTRVKTESSGIFLIEVNVRKLLPF